MRKSPKLQGTLRDLDVPEEMVLFSESMNTSYGVMYGKEILYIGTDVLPATGRATVRANSRLSMKAVIAHEVTGHRAAQLAGRTHSVLVLEEAQASIRAARFAPGLSSTERVTLLRDALERLPKGTRIRDVKPLLWINEP